MALQTGQGAEVFIGPANNSADDVSAFEAIDEAEWTKIGEMEDINRLGDTWSTAEFVGLEDGRERHFKATKNGGEVTLQVGMDPKDEGQQALLSAWESKSEFLMRVFMDDDPDDGPDSAPTTFYWRGLVTGKELSGIQNGNVTRRNVTVRSNSGLIEVVRQNHTE